MRSILRFQIFWLITALCIAPQVVLTQEAASKNEPVRFLSAPPLRKQLQALPLIAGESKPVERINASLKRYNQSVLKASRDCDADYAGYYQEMVQSGIAKRKNQAKESWSRSVSVTMAGPRFVSYLANDSMYCGGAYPDENLLALVFDLRDGSLVDWNKMLSPGSVEEDLGTSSDGLVVPMAESASLTKVYLRKVHPIQGADCKDVFEESDFEASFFVWLDGKAKAVVIQPSLPHAVQGCALPVKLNAAEQKTAGFSAEIIQATTIAQSR